MIFHDEDTDTKYLCFGRLMIHCTDVFGRSGLRFGMTRKWWITITVGAYPKWWRPPLSVHVHSWAFGFCFGIGGEWDRLIHLRLWPAGTSGSL